MCKDIHGNDLTLKEIIAKVHSQGIQRSNTYHKPVKYSQQEILSAKAVLTRLKAKQLATPTSHDSVTFVSSKYRV